MIETHFPFAPKIKLDLDGPGGNIFEIIGRCRVVARQCRFDRDKIEEFSNAVMATDSYDAALAVVREWFDVKETA